MTNTQERIRPNPHLDRDWSLELLQIHLEGVHDALTEGSIVELKERHEAIHKTERPASEWSPF